MNIFVDTRVVTTGDDDLRTAFGKYGQVDSAQVIMDRQTGRSRGFGFVEMPSDDEAREAITGMNGTDLAGRLGAGGFSRLRRRVERRGG